MYLIGNLKTADAVNSWLLLWTLCRRQHAVNSWFWCQVTPLITVIVNIILQAARAGSILQDDSQPTQTANNAGSEENAAKILTYEEAFQQIKEATGVSDTAEVVERSVLHGC